MGTGQDTEAIVRYAAEIPGADPEALGRAIRLHELVRQTDQDFDRYLRRDGLSASRFRILEALFFQKDHTLTPAELADRVYLTRAAVTTVLDGLEKKGYIVRAVHETDRRMIAVRLTDEGLALTRQVLPKHLLAFSNIARGIPREEMMIIVSAFERIAAGVRRLLGEPE